MKWYVRRYRLFQTDGQNQVKSSYISPHTAQYVEFNTFYLENISLNNTLDLTCELYLITSNLL